MNEDRAIRLDRMRFIKNTLSSSLALLAILFDVFFFINIYKSDIHNNVGNFYYQIRIRASIIYNLIFMLAAFLASEGIKNYKIRYVYVLAALGIGQIVRIFILPARAAATEVTVGGVTSHVMEAAQHTRVVMYLLISAGCCLAAAAVGYKRSRDLAAYLASLEKGNEA